MTWPCSVCSMSGGVAITIGLVCAAIAGVGVSSLPSTFEAYAIPMLLATVVFVVICILSGVLRSRRRGGRVDPFDPLILPTAYVAVTCLAPVFWMWSTDSDLGYVQKSMMSSQTPALMALAVVGFALGAAVPFGRREISSESVDVGTLAIAGRVLLCFPLLLAANGVLNHAVVSRGSGQNVVVLRDSIFVLGVLVATAAVVILLAANERKGGGLLTKGEWVLVLSLLLLLGLNGSRGGALGVMITVLLFASRRGVTSIRVVFGGLAMVAFAYIVVTYRSRSVGETADNGLVQTVLSDLGSVAFTTGVTAQDIGRAGYLGGSTIIAAAERQLPGPLANSLFGQPSDTGAFQFRAISGYTNPSNGYGFSLPAEGVMNFGTVGAFMVPFVAGVVLAWLYAGFSPSVMKARSLAYAIAVGTVPFALRSDVLGAVKGVLYPTIMVFAVFALAKSMRSRAPAELLDVRPGVSCVHGHTSTSRPLPALRS